MKYCNKCNIQLTNANWYTSSKKKHYYICINCHKERGKKYDLEHREELLAYGKKYRLEHREEIRLHDREFYQEHKKERCLYQKNYKQSEVGKKTVARGQAKRKRNLGWILMFPNPFADSVPVDFHHLTNTYVIAIPRDLHELYMSKYHRENLMTIIKQIYLKE